MKKMVSLMLFSTALSIPLQPSKAQEKSSEKPKSEESNKVSIPLRVQVVFAEYDGEKKILSTPYTFIVLTDEKVGGNYSTSLRTGARIPVETDGKEQKTTYLDVGSNIDCGVHTEEDGRFHLRMIFERSAIDEKLEVARPNGQPLIRQFRTSENLILKDGQTSESILSTDPLNGHVMRISVTINSLK